MKADQLIPGNWYYHNDVLVKFIMNVKTDQKGYRFERAVGRSYSAFSLSAEEIEKEITHELKFVADRDSDCPSCCLEYTYGECEVIGNCSMINREDMQEGYYIKAEIKDCQNHQGIVNARDYIQELREALKKYRSIEVDLITTSPEFRESDMENYSDSYKYLLLQVPDDQLQTPSSMIGSNIEDFPNDVLAGILLEVLKSQETIRKNLTGLAIDRVGTSFEFCISGSISLGEIQNLCEQYQETHGSEGEK